MIEFLGYVNKFNLYYEFKKNIIIYDTNKNTLYTKTLFKIHKTKLVNYKNNLNACLRYFFNQAWHLPADTNINTIKTEDIMDTQARRKSFIIKMLNYT